MNANPPLLVFADDWGRHPSSCQHLIQELLPQYQVTWVNMAEAVMIFYSAFAVFYAIKHNLYGMIHFHVMLLIGYSMVFWLSLKRPKNTTII